MSNPEPELQWPEGLDKAGFLAQHWQQRALLWRQAFAEFESPLSVDELAGLAMEEDIPSRLLLQDSSGQWHLRHGPFAAEALTELPSAGWSLLVSDVDKHLPDMRAWLQPFRFIPDWRIDDLMISCAPAGGSVGAHTDNYDVFLLQASGRREWQIDTQQLSGKALQANQPVGILADFVSSDTHVLEPGDMLYLPPGVPHHGIALDNDCMTWSIGFRAPTQAHLVRRLAHHLTAPLDDTFYTDRGLQQQAHPALISDAAIDELYAIWQRQQQPDRAEFAQAVGRVLTEAGESAETSNEDKDGHASPAATPLTDSDYWELHGHAQLAFIDAPEDGTQVWLFANGRQYKTSRALAELLTGPAVMAADALIEHQDDAESLQHLIQRGVLIPLADD